MSDAVSAVRDALQRLDVDFEAVRGRDTFVAVMPGERKLRTTCSLVVGPHSLTVNAFVVRHPDENTAACPRMAAATKRQAPWSGVRHRPARRCVPGWPVADLRQSTSTRSTQLLGRVLDAADTLVQHAARIGFRLQHSAGMGVAGIARRVADQPGGVRAPHCRA